MIFGIAAYQEHGTAQLILWLLMLVATRKTRNKQFKRIKRCSIMERAHAWRPARNRRGESGSKFSFVLFSLRYKKNTKPGLAYAHTGELHFPIGILPALGNKRILELKYWRLEIGTQRQQQPRKHCTRKNVTVCVGDHISIDESLSWRKTAFMSTCLAPSFSDQLPSLPSVGILLLFIFASPHPIWTPVKRKIINISIPCMFRFVIFNIDTKCKNKNHIPRCTAGIPTVVYVNVCFLFLFQNFGVLWAFAKVRRYLEDKLMDILFCFTKLGV